MIQEQWEREINDFAARLQEEEREPSTIEKYLRDIRKFAAWAGDRTITKEITAGWKEALVCAGYCPGTVNGMLSSLNRMLAFSGRSGCRVRYLRIQRRLFRKPERELTREEYKRLISTAQAKGRNRLALLIETICAVGIRVSEVKYITVDAVREGRAEVYMKGKVRTILLPNKLCRKLQKYAKQQKIPSGEIFRTRSGKSISRRQIWAEMKSLCKAAGVASSKVFPHNLRHLFARVFYQSCRDIAKLADLLGHSSIETTRIYLVSTGVEHIKKLERLGLLC